jgi:hypothetical protein
LHFGFAASDRAAVRAHRARVTDTGAQIVGQCVEPAHVSFKCRDPDGYIVEVSWELRP